MRFSPLIVALYAAMLLPALAGCEDKRSRLSSSAYLLARQHETWNNTRRTLQDDQPNMGLFRSLHIFLRGRTRRRVAKDYTGPDKQQVLDQLDAVGALYQAEVLSLMDLSSPVPKLRGGVTVQQLREAFAKVDQEYRRLEAITAPE